MCQSKGNCHMGKIERLKMAFVGCGLIARSHWKGVQEHAPRVEVTAAVDTDRKRADEMAAQTGGKPFYSLEEALEEGNFDAVDIMLPHNQHEAATVQAFAAGKHVLLEKPMSTTLASCDRILAAAATAGTLFMVAEQSEYWPDAVAIRQLIRDGALGDIVTARATFGGHTPFPLGDSPKPWRYDKEISGGGIVIDGGAHWIRPLRMWLGEIDEVVAVLGHPVAEMEGESLARALFRFESGVVAVFDALRAGFEVGPREDFRITGTAGEIVIEKGREGRVLFFDRDTPKGRDIMPEGKGHKAGFGLELDDFSYAVLEGRPLAAGPEYSLGELRTALAMYRSAESRRWEKVWD
jgi:UDP-N-acetyl-2-amino-2-deoxyglucuronate dehydrogenase